MLESFHSQGRLPRDKLLLKRSHNEKQILGAQFLRSFAVILSGPVALFSSRVARTW